MAHANTLSKAILADSIADMLGIPVTPLQDGARVWVGATQTNYYLSRTSALPVDNINVFKPIFQALPGASSAKWISGAASGSTLLVEGTTLAVLPTISGADANTILFVFDTEAEYRWSPGGSLPQDGWVIVDAAGGQWILQGDRLTLTPLGGGADDWVRLFGAGGAAPAAAAQGKAIALNAGTWQCQTVQVLPSNLVLYGGSDVFIQSTLPNTGNLGVTNSVFRTEESNTSANILLTSDAVLGTTTIDVASPVAAGSTLVIGWSLSGVQQQQATVLSTSNGGLTLLLDEEILYNYWTVANGAFVHTYTPTSNITIYGNGMTVFGTGDRVCEFLAGRNNHADNIIVNPSLNTGPDGFLNPLFAIDIARDSGFSNCRADGGVGILSGAVSVLGFVLGSSVRCYIEDCEAENMDPVLGPGFALSDSRQVIMTGCSARNSRAGVLVSSNNTFGVEGTRGADIVGFRDTNCTFGIQVNDASHLRVKGWSSTAAANPFASGTAPGNQITIAGFEWTARPAGSFFGWDTLFGNVNMQDGIIDMTSTSGTKAVCNWAIGDGTLRFDRIVTKGGDFGIFLVDALAQRFIRGVNVDLSSTAVPYTKGTLSRLNFGTVAANGVTPIPPVVAACTSKDSVTLQAAGGTPTSKPVLSSIGADTFSLLAGATDNNTYNWWIVPGGP